MSTEHSVISGSSSPIFISWAAIGKLLPTSSHLFKLILPLGISLTHPTTNRGILMSPVLTNLHPWSSFYTPPSPFHTLADLSTPRLDTLHLIFHSAVLPPGAKPCSGQIPPILVTLFAPPRRSAEFTIAITHEHDHGRRKPHARNENEDNDAALAKDTLLTVTVPTLADRTRFMQRRLRLVGRLLNEMEGLKERCDAEARRGARHMALGGLGMLIVYWGAVARLTFWDYGWCVTVR